MFIVIEYAALRDTDSNKPSDVLSESLFLHNVQCFNISISVLLCICLCIVQII